MRINALLTELELMPRWQLRDAATAPVIIAANRWTAMAVTTAQGVAGWAVAAQPMAAEAESLFMNMLGAMKLRGGVAIEIDPRQVAEEIALRRISWLWLLGEDLMPMLEVLPQASTADGILRGASVFQSAHPSALLTQPERKSTVWAEWCAYIAGLNG